MDDLSQKLDQLLGSPDGMKRIEELMAAFGAAPPGEAPVPPAPVPAAAADPLASLLGNSGDMAPLLKLLPLIGQLQKEDDNADLLRALRPHLKTDRQKRLDEATQMMKLVKLLPLLKEFSGKGEDGS